MASKGNKRSKSKNNSKKKTSYKSKCATTQTNKKPSDGSKDETKEAVENVPAAQGNPTAKEPSQTSSDSDSSAAQGNPTAKEPSQTSSDSDSSAAQGDPTAKESSQTSSDSDRKIEYTSDKTILHLLLRYKKEKKLRYFKIFEDKIPEKWATKSARLRILLTQMRRVKWWFHFTRNNPNHTKRFYYRFKAIVGLEDWDKINPDIRQAWEDAANRFDVQFGLVRAWTMTPWVLDPESTIPKNEPDWLISLRKTIESQNDIVKELRELKSILINTPNQIEENLKKMKDLASEAEKTGEQIKMVLTVYQAIGRAKTEQNKGEDSIS